MPLKTLLWALLMSLAFALPAQAAERPLFVNLTSDDAWRAGMALSFSNNALKRGHPVTVFLNVEAVRIADTTLPQGTNSVTGKTPIEMLKGLIADGATVIVCPMCMKAAGVQPGDLVAGAQMGKPELTLPRLFGDDTQVISY
jgi:predicted peroxiredoxin